MSRARRRLPNGAREAASALRKPFYGGHATTLAAVLVLAAAIPIVFLHVDYQPSVSFGLGSTSVGIELSDLAVIAVGLTALWAGVRRGFSPLRGVLSLWLAAALPQTVTNTLYLKYSARLGVSHALGWLARLVIAAAAYVLIVG